ncbi:MAG: PKD domain-containing protein [Candidatus Cloacimonetes bacterium]|nr:PKD domain-containing protein [Candidatus Cloacimonadota bacterium]
MKTLNFIFVFIFILLSSFLYATIINVPADQPTIQAGINAAVNSDTVLVQPGTYLENINFNGKLITVGSLFLTTQDTTYISQTIIDGNSIGSVVTFGSGEDSSTVLCGFTITNGSATFGGGIYCYNSSPSLSDLIIMNNWGDGTGGAICCKTYSNPTIDNVIIKGNSAVSGGGVSCIDNSNPLFKNVLIVDNNSNSAGGGIECHYSNPVLINVSIVGNIDYGNNGGGVYLKFGSEITVINSIIWDNNPNEIEFRPYNEPNSIMIAYSDIQGGEAGIVTNNNGTVNWLEGNIDADPLFVDPGSGDYHLTENSPCIDVGDPTSPLDPDGTIADMGAFYYHQGLLANFEADVTSGLVPLEVQFTDLSTPPDSTISWQWDFENDGIIDSYLQNPIYTYNEGGIYTVSLTVSDGTNEDTEIKEDYINVDQPIVVTELIPPEGNIIIDEGDVINFSIDAYDPDGNPLEFSWQLDGVEVSTDSTYIFETDYTSAGEYVVTLEVTDNFGTRRITSISRNTLNYSWDVTVDDVDQPIVVNELIPPEGDITIDEGDVINFSIDAYDPDGNDLEYSWQVEGVEVSVVSTFDFITDENSAGEYEVTLFVTDNFGTRDELNFLWNVTVNDVSGSGEVLIPIVTKLYQNHPNPFNPITNIRFDIKENESGALSIYNTKGQFIESYQFEAGQHNFSWNAENQSSGVYFYKLQTESFIDVRKMILLK